MLNLFKRETEPLQAKFALALSGGGARGAYEAGVVHYLRTQLPPEIAQSPLFQIYCGTSVGAINSAFMAATAHDPIYQGGQLKKVWENLSDSDVYQTDTKALTGFLMRSGFFMATNFFGLDSLLGKTDTGQSFPFKSILETTPFVQFLRRQIPWKQIRRNMEKGLVEAVTVSATHILTGKLTLFIEKHSDTLYRKGRDEAIFGPISPKHVLASAAIPLVFPLIRIQHQVYGDGGLRQNTPMSPAIHLGADRILVISMQGKRAASEQTQPGFHGPDPTMGDVLGLLLDSVFQNHLEYDLEQMYRINSLLDDVEHTIGGEILSRINQLRGGRKGEEEDNEKMRKIVPLVVSPEEDIGLLASAHFHRILATKSKLTPMQRFFAKVMENSPENPNDLVSYLLFDRDYLQSLLEMGFKDAQKQHDQLITFFTGESDFSGENPLKTDPPKKTNP